MKNKISFIRADRTVISEKVKESVSSVFPIALIVLLLSFSVVPIESGVFLAFALGTLLVIVGMVLFTLGADTAMTPIGEYVGTSVMKTKKLWIIIPICFVVGVMITVAEPDLQVLAGQLAKTIGPWILIIAVGVGVGLFLVVAFLRIVLKIRLTYLLLGCYIAVFALSFFVPEVFVPLAFDSGGVTTGPMSVPFIIAIGTGVAAMRSDKNAETDGFGLTALCSVGPILSVMVLGIIFKPETIDTSAALIPTVENSKELLKLFVYELPHYMEEVLIGLLPIVSFFFIFQLFGYKVSHQQLVRIVVGIIYTYLGLVVFLLGVNVGFLPVGAYLGETLGALSYNWIIVPIGMLVGYFVVAAEPAVHVLTKQVYEITSGAIAASALRTSLMIGVSVSAGLSMLRIILHIPIMYFLVPGYLIAIVLAFLVPDIFTAIAFDSGGVASGAMTASFLMPFALGACRAVGGNIATEGFGVVAMVAMTPLITIQILGLVYKIKTTGRKGANDTASYTEDIIE